MATLIREPPFFCISSSGSFDTYIYRKGSDAGDNFMGISMKSDARRGYIQRIVVLLQNNSKKDEAEFGNFT